jgi:hypothetical protein
MTDEQAAHFVEWCDYLSRSEWAAFTTYWGDWIHNIYMAAGGYDGVNKT